MRRYGVLAILALVLLIAALKSQPSAPALALAPAIIATQSATPTIGILFPIILKQPTLTPTPTDTATPTSTSTHTQTPTDTPTASKTPVAVSFFPFILQQPTSTPSPTNTPPPTSTSDGLPSPQHMEGNVRRDDPNKPTYATNIENIFFWEWIHNANAAPVDYGILGVDIFKDAGYNFFHTSWNGQLASGGVLQINGNGCYGPLGGNCAPDIGSGQWRDSVIVAQPGHYIMTLSICQSRFPACSQPGGSWQDLSSVTFDAIDWTPTPSVQGPVTPTPAPSEACQLIRNDPRGTYLHCRQGPHMKERALSH